MYLHIHVYIYTHNIDSGFCSREIGGGVEVLGRYVDQNVPPPSFPPSDGFRKLLVSCMGKIYHTPKTSKHRNRGWMFFRVPKTYLKTPEISGGIGGVWTYRDIKWYRISEPTKSGCFNLLLWYGGEMSC